MLFFLYLDTVNFSTTQGLAMPIKKYLILSLLSFVIYSCANDSSSGPSPTLINGQWNSDQYLYSPNCGQQDLSFDDYISYLVVELQQYSAQIKLILYVMASLKAGANYQQLMTPMIQMQIQFMQFNFLL